MAIPLTILRDYERVEIPRQCAENTRRRIQHGTEEQHFPATEPVADEPSRHGADNAADDSRRGCQPDEKGVVLDVQMEVLLQQGVCPVDHRRVVAEEEPANAGHRRAKDDEADIEDRRVCGRSMHGFDWVARSELQAKGVSLTSPCRHALRLKLRTCHPKRLLQIRPQGHNSPAGHWNSLAGLFERLLAGITQVAPGELHHGALSRSAIQPRNDRTGQNASTFNL